MECADVSDEVVGRQEENERILIRFRADGRCNGAHGGGVARRRFEHEPRGRDAV